MNTRRAVPSAAMLAALLVAGCANRADRLGSALPASAVSTENDDSLDTAAGEARRTGRPLAILVVDPQRSAADRLAREAFEAVIGGGDADRASVIPVLLDLELSRNRAAAAPLQALAGPTLVCVSPDGVNVSHDQGAITVTLIRQRIAAAVAASPGVDRELRELRSRVAGNGRGMRDQMKLAEFLLGHGNDREAIAPLDAVAHDENAEPPARVRAWVELGRAHLAIGEPEKARHSAEALIGTLGRSDSEARAGGELVRGLQDSKAKRFDRAREELSAAAHDAPDSPYGKEAAGLLAKLPGGGGG